jgi:hypothetical protein
MSKVWTVTLEHDGADLILPLTEDMLEGTDIQVGDTVEWIDNKDGSWTLRKKDSDKVWVMVETISTFRQRYMIQAPASNPEYALDDVSCETAKEFSQQWLGETIVSHRVVSQTEALEICDQDNDYAASWNDDYKMNTFFTFQDEEIEEERTQPEWQGFEFNPPRWGGEKCNVCGFTREEMGRAPCAFEHCGLHLNERD